MKPPWYMKISFEKKEPIYKGFIKGGWIETPSNKQVGLPCSVWVSFNFWYRIWLCFLFCSRLRIVRK